MSQNDEFRGYAKMGLQSEIARLQALLEAVDAQVAPAAPVNGNRRRTMTAAQRAEVSKRMKAMWAAKHKERARASARA